MKIVADLHTHSVASSHAYSTLGENCREAEARGLYAIALTDHGPKIEDGAHPYHFAGIANVLPRKIHGVYVLRGIESNILNEAGEVDIDPSWGDVLDFAIASIHSECFGKSNPEKTTNAYLNVLDNPLVDILGHSGTEEYAYDYERVIKKCARTGKLVEINAASFKYRMTSMSHCRRIASLCAHYGARIMVNSDAHVAQMVGEVSSALKMLKDINFPEELVVNSSLPRLSAYFKETKRLDILDERA